MSAAEASGVATRVALFEVGPSAYGLPIADVLEVVERGRVCGIPTLPVGTAGVMNHQGDALPWVARTALFQDADAEREAEHVLVLAGAGGEAARLGIPVDRVLGLADLMIPDASASDMIVARIPFRDRVISILDARRVLERAEQQIEQQACAVG